MHDYNEDTNSVYRVGSYKAIFNKFNNKLNTIDSRFKLIDVYNIKCPEGHIIHGYVSKFIKPNIKCEYCEVVNNNYLFEYLNSISDLKYIIKQNFNNITNHQNKKYRSVISLEIYLKYKNNLKCKIHFIKSKWKASLGVNKDIKNIYEFDYMKINDKDYCETYINDILGIK